MTTLKFTKMQGLGNDFVVLDGIRQRVELSATQSSARRATRTFGTGSSTRMAARSNSAATVHAAS